MRTPRVRSRFYARIEALLTGRKRVRSVGLYGFVTALPQLASGLLAILYTRAFSPEEYANYGIFAAVLALISFLIDFALPAAVLRNVSADMMRDRVASAVLGARALSALILPLAAALLYLFWDAIGVRFPQRWAFIPVLLAISYLDVCSELLATVCRAFHRPEYFVAGRLAKATVIVVAGTLFVFVFRLGVMGALLALLAAEAGAFLVYEVITRRKLGVRNGRLDLKLLRADLQFSLPLVPTRLAGWARLLAVRPILSHLVPMSSVGLFSFASSLSILPNLLSTAVDLALAPIYFQRRDASASGGFARKLQTFLEVYLAGLLPIWAVAVLFSRDAIVFAAGDQYLGAAPTLAVLLCASYARMQLPFLLRQIHFLRKTWILPVITLPATGVSLVLIAVLAGDFGITGAAVVTLGTDVVMLIVSAWVVRRFEKIDYPIVKSLAFTGGLTALAAWSNFTSEGLLLRFWIAIAIAIGCTTFWIWPNRRLVLQLTRG